MDVVYFAELTPHQFSPAEVLLGQPYDYSCDWWSLGIIIFEMLYGYPPFASKTREGTRTKIIEWRRWLKFPNYVTRKTESGEYDYAGEVSRDACDIIRKLLTDAAERIGSLQPQQLTQSGSSENAAAARSAAILSTMLLGKDGQEIQKHPWFRGVDFGALWEKEAPWKPDLKSDVDTSYFDEMLNDVGVAGPYGAGLGTTAELLQDEGAIAAATAQTGPSSADTDAETLELRKRLAFTGFTYKGAASLRSEFIKQIQTPPPQRRGSASNGNRPS